jgi:hypothetical protein
MDGSFFFNLFRCDPCWWVWVRGWVLVGVLVGLVGVGMGQVRTVIEDGGAEEPFRVRLYGEKDDVPVRQGPLKVLGLDDRVGLKEHIEEMAFESRRRIREMTGVDWEGTAYVVWVDEEREFMKFTGFRPEHVAAAANARRHTIWINASAWTRASPGDNRATLAHEIGHLLVGNLTQGRRLPLWAEEGLVMRLAGQGGVEHFWSLAQARLMGSIPRLADLETEFPRDPARQTLAYATGHAAIGVVAMDYGDEPGSVTRLMRRLADEEVGPELVEALWDEGRRDGWNEALLDSLGSRLRYFVIIGTSGGAIWMIAMVLLVWAWRVKLRRRRAAEVIELVEEPWLESLSSWGFEGDLGGAGGSAGGGGGGDALGEAFEGASGGGGEVRMKAEG